MKFLIFECANSLCIWVTLVRASIAAVIKSVCNASLYWFEESVCLGLSFSFCIYGLLRKNTERQVGGWEFGRVERMLFYMY